MDTSPKAVAGEALHDMVATLTHAAPYEISNQWFHDNHIRFDGFSFNNCRFDNCILHVKVGLVGLNRCFFADCTFLFEDGAQRAVKVYNILQPDHGSFWGGGSLSPTIHEDGTFSIAW